MLREYKGKAENLEILSKIHGVLVPRFVVLHPYHDEAQRKQIVIDFLEECQVSSVAVRSSAPNEDSENASFAGMYTTKLNVPANLEDILISISEVSNSGYDKSDVIAHYAKHRNIDLSDDLVSVIIQEMVESSSSGVIFSHDPVVRDGYYLVSITEGIGESIVSGKVDGKLIRIARGLDFSQVGEGWLRKLIQTTKEIESVYGSTSLDIEFTFKESELYILQCRPITTACSEAMNEISELKIVDEISHLNSTLVEEYRHDVLGDMIDINPLELLGQDPSTLDVSIFRQLFADHIVEKVRKGMGYEPLNVGLLRVISGKPYVSMNASAHSFRPAKLPIQIYYRMVEVYRSILISNPGLQSSFEFDVCAMSLGDTLEKVMELAALNDAEKSEVRSAFSELDSSMVGLSEIASDECMSFLSNYTEGISTVRTLPLPQAMGYVTAGTEMFVRVARLAFYWKNKFEEVYPQADLNYLLDGYIHTVSGDLQNDLVACRNGDLDQSELVNRYGHLRPGQLSILGESYSDDPEHYLFSQMKKATRTVEKRSHHPFAESIEFRNTVEFMQARETVKFMFTKALHYLIKNLQDKLRVLNLSLSDVVNLTWDEVLDFIQEPGSVKINVREENQKLILPNVIIPGLTNLGIVEYPKATPTYITKSVIKAPLYVLNGHDLCEGVEGCLVLLPNADPGYDFLFHSNIAGIITMSGGPASHMCIRAIEMQVPACIGCGEAMYQVLKSCETAVLDCSNKQIIIT